MKLIVLLGLAASVSGLALPIRLQTTNAAPAAINSINLDDFWVTDVHVGTPGQKISLLIDTYGTSVWMKDSSCTDEWCQNQYGLDLFYSNRSSTYQAEGLYNYSDHLGKQYGFAGSDIFTMGQIANKSTQFRTNFGQVNESWDNNIGYVPGLDGVLGLAGQRNSNIMDDAFNQGAWKKNVVTLMFEKQFESSDKGTSGVLYYGDYDPLHCDYSYSVTNADPVLYRFTTTKFTLYNNGTQLFSSNQYRQTVIRSNSIWMMLPKTLNQQILTSIGLNPNSQMPVYVDCNLLANLTFSFTNAKGTETIQGINMNRPYDGKCEMALINSHSQPVFTVTYALSPESNQYQGGTENIMLGMPFLRGRCTFLDRAQGTIGFGVPKKRGSDGNK